MRKDNVITRIEDLAAPLVAAQGAVLWGVEMLPGGAGFTVRVYVDSPEGSAADSPEGSATNGPEGSAAERPDDLGADGTDNGTDGGAGATGELRGVDIDRLATISRQLGLALEVEELFGGPYRLEVSSPGFERPFFSLEQLAGHAGEKVEIKTHEPLDGRKNFTGTLASAADGTVGVMVDGRHFELDWDNVRRARLVVDDPWAYTKARRAGRMRDRPAR